MATPIKVLSIDGGGIRGIIPAMILQRIEQETGRPIAELFDLIAGTSTGGILALGLTVPRAANSKEPKYSAAELVALYDREGENIFDRTVWHTLRSGWGIGDERYPAKGLETVLEKYFGTTKLSDAVTEVLVTAYGLERRQPLFFKRHKARAEAERNFLMTEAARATSAAPTYFEPLKLDVPGSNDYHALVDGGVFANNPAMCAYVEAKTLFPKAKDFLVVSLGTGEMTRKFPFEKAKDWGLIAWAQRIMDIVFDGVSDTVSYQLAQLLETDSGPGRRYYRFQTELSAASDDMDDASQGNIRNLRLRAEKILRDSRDQVDELCKLLGKAEGLTFELGGELPAGSPEPVGTGTPN